MSPKPLLAWLSVLGRAVSSRTRPREPVPSATRLALGFALAPIVAPIAVGAYDLSHIASMDWPEPKIAGSARDSLTELVTTVVPLGYAAALAVGVPIVLWLRRAGRLSVAWLLPLAGVGGAALSLAPLALMWLAGVVSCVGEDDCLTPLFVVPPGAALLAAGVAGAFCAIARVPLRATSRASP
jgi:hypothetical protein